MSEKRRMIGMKRNLGVKRPRLNTDSSEDQQPCPPPQNCTSDDSRVGTSLGFTVPGFDYLRPG